MSAVMPVSWQTLQSLKQRIALITRDGGYMTDTGLGQIVTDRTQLPEQGDSVLIVGGNFRRTDASKKALNEDMDVTIERGIWLGDGATPDPEFEAHCTRVDLMRALSIVMRDAPLGLRVTVGEDSFIGDPPDGSNYLIVQVTARAGLSELFPPAN